jgi:hypothetical protein
MGENANIDKTMSLTSRLLLLADKVSDRETVVEICTIANEVLNCLVDKPPEGTGPLSQSFAEAVAKYKSMKPETSWADKRKIIDRLIREWNRVKVPTNVAKALIREGILDYRGLSARTDESISELKCIGATGMASLRSAMQSLGISFAEATR